MKRKYFFIILLVLGSFYIFGITKNSMSSNSICKQTTIQDITLYFKISGLHSDLDARIVDKTLLSKSFVVSAITNLETGICTVITDNIDNKEKIRETICSASKKIGNKINAEYIENYIEPK